MKILSEVDILIIAVGSAEFKNIKRNPFSGYERKQMIEAYLKENKIHMKKVRIVNVADGKSFYSAIKNLFKTCGEFDVLYTDKETIIKLIQKKVKIKHIKRTGTISSTKIRDAIASNKNWEHLTGKSVVELIKKFNGIKRIKKAYSEDK